MNKCQKCKKARATVHLTEIDPDNHKPHEMHLCESCARETGMPQGPQPSTTQTLSFSASITNLGKVRAGGTRQLVCASCGMSYQEFRVKGRFGCCDCYDSFAEGVVPLLDRVHGANRYVGPQPAKAPDAEEGSAAAAAFERELIDLRRRLTRVVEDEDYEEAARIRDRIHEVETRLGEAGNG
jgi:protein arginine kinase activator